MQKEIKKNNFDEAQNKYFSYIKEETTFNLVNIELKLLLKKCNVDIGMYCIESNISSIDYNNNIIVIGTFTGDVIILDILYGDKQLSFNAHSEIISSVNIIENNLILTHISNLDKTTLKLWRIEQTEQLIWEISHPVFFPDNIHNNDSFKLFKDFLVLNKKSNIAFTPCRKMIAFSTGGYAAVADINTSKIIYYVEMQQPTSIIMKGVNFINKISFSSKLNYGIASSLHKTIYWNIGTGNIVENLTEEEKEAIDDCNNKNIKSNLFNLRIDHNKVTIFERNPAPCFLKHIQYYIHNTKGNNNFVVIEDKFMLCSNYANITHGIENNYPFLINFYAEISACGNYLLTTKPSNMSEPGNIDIYSTNNGKYLTSYAIKNIYSHRLMKLITIYCVGAYVTNDYEVIGYISDNSIRTYRKNKDADVYQTNINKTPSKVLFYNKNLLCVLYADGSICIWKYDNDDKWINIETDIKNISCVTFISEYIVALCDTNGYLFFWKLDDNSFIKSNWSHTNDVNCLLLTPDHERLILGCNNRIKIVTFNIYLEKITNLLDIVIRINPENIYIDTHKNEIIAVEKNNGLEVIRMEKAYENKEDIAIEKFNYRKMLLFNNEGSSSGAR